MSHLFISSYEKLWRFQERTRLSLRLNHFVFLILKYIFKMSKICHDDSHNCMPEDDDQRSSRPRHDFQNNIQQLHTLIDNQLQMIPSHSLNMVERLHEIIDEQNEWLAASVNDGAQIGRGPSNDNASDYDPSAPDMGLTRSFIDRLISEGGRVGDFTIIPRQRFNGLEIHRTLHFREIATDDYAAYHILLHDILNEIIDFSRLMAGENGFMNVSLHGESLPTDINAVLTPDNNHDVNTFVDQIERAVQSNADVGCDSALQLCVSVVRNRQGGVRRKLSDLAHNMVIQKNKMNFFAPKNITNNMCFSICLANFLNPQCPDQELVRIGRDIHMH